MAKKPSTIPTGPVWVIIIRMNRAIAVCADRDSRAVSDCRSWCSYHLRPQTDIVVGIMQAPMV